MLEKTPGAVLCGHCHALGADALCRYCRRPVHERCLESLGCPEPHPRELRLGLGWRLRDIDEEGRFALVGHVLGGEQARDLAGKGELVIVWPDIRHNGLPVTFLGLRAIGPGLLVLPASTYTVEGSADNEIVVYHDPLLVQASVDSTGLQDLRLVARPNLPLELERLLLTGDARTAALVSASRFDLIDLSGRRPAQVVDLRGEMIFDLALSGEMSLAVAAVFGRLRCFGLDGQLRGAIQLEDGDVTAVALGGGRVAAVTAELTLHVREAGGGPPDGWRRVLHTDVEARGRIAPSQLALSHDGRLLALRQRRKEVLVIDLESGERQLLRGHTDTVCFVRFIAGGRLLVTGDDDNRVRIWPRSGERIVSGD